MRHCTALLACALTLTTTGAAQDRLSAELMAVRAPRGVKPVTFTKLILDGPHTGEKVDVTPQFRMWLDLRIGRAALVLDWSREGVFRDGELLEDAAAVVFSQDTHPRAFQGALTWLRARGLNYEELERLPFRVRVRASDGTSYPEGMEAFLAGAFAPPEGSVRSVLVVQPASATERSDADASFLPDVVFALNLRGRPSEVFSGHAGVPVCHIPLSEPGRLRIADDRFALLVERLKSPSFVLKGLGGKGFIGASEGQLSLLHFRRTQMVRGVRSDEAIWSLRKWFSEYPHSRAAKAMRSEPDLLIGLAACLPSSWRDEYGLACDPELIIFPLP